MEEQQILKVILNIFNGSDTQQWNIVRNSFATDVYLDYFSLNGQPGETIKADEIILTWSRFLPKFKFTLHMLTNLDIKAAGVNATVFSKVQALHHLPGTEGGDLWTVYGTYDFELLKSKGQWLVISMKFNLLYQDGNKNLPLVAMAEKT